MKKENKNTGCAGFCAGKVIQKTKTKPQFQKVTDSSCAPSEVFGREENDSMPEFRLLMNTAQSSTAEYLLKRNQFQKHALSTHWLNQT